MNIFLAVLGVHEFFHLGFPYTNILVLFFTFFLPHGHKLIFLYNCPCRAWWHCLGTAKGHARTMKTLMGKVAGELQKYNIRAREN